MTISDEILKARNSLLTNVLIEIKIEGNADKCIYPQRCIVTNKKNGKKWSVEFHSKPYDDPDSISPVDWYAELKDEKGNSLETKDIDRHFYPDIKLDSILIGKSGYRPIWRSVNSEFKKFQREHRRITNNKERKRCNDEIAHTMINLRNFLRRER